MTASDDPVVSTVTAADGTRLAATRIPGGGGMPVLICNGVGAGLSLWSGVLGHLREHRTALTWDYRGLNASGPAATDSYGPEVQASDAVSVLDAGGIEEVVVAAWSSGTRVALELAATQPERICALVLVCGAHGHDVRRLITNLEIGSVLPPVARLLRLFHSSLAGPFRSLMSRPEATGVLRQSGLIQTTTDTSALLELFRTMAANDLRVQLATFEAVAGNSDAKSLPRVVAPTLLIGGAQDRFVSADLMRQARRLLPNARLEIYERASHYLPLEHPHRLASDIEAFLDDVL